jgi:hypothetical protein
MKGEGEPPDFIKTLRTPSKQFYKKPMNTPLQILCIFGFE